MEQGPQGHTGVTRSDRTVRQLGVVVANTQIELANQYARLEEVAETATHINFDLWEGISAQPVPPQDDAMEGHTESEMTAIAASPARSYLVPEYQVDVVARLLGMLLRQ